MLALLMASLMACSSPTKLAKEESYKKCEQLYHSNSSRFACQEGARYRFNGNQDARSQYYCRKLQPYEVDACYRGVGIFSEEFNKNMSFSKNIGEVDSSAIAVNEESNSSVEFPLIIDEHEAITDSGVSSI